MPQDEDEISAKKKRFKILGDGKVIGGRLANSDCMIQRSKENYSVDARGQQLCLLPTPRSSRLYALRALKIRRADSPVQEVVRHPRPSQKRLIKAAKGYLRPSQEHL